MMIALNRSSVRKHRAGDDGSFEGVGKTFWDGVGYRFGVWECRPGGTVDFCQSDSARSTL